MDLARLGCWASREIHEGGKGKKETKRQESVARMEQAAQAGSLGGDRRGRTRKVDEPNGFAALVPRDRPARRTSPSLEDTAPPLRGAELAMSLCLSLEFA